MILLELSHEEADLVEALLHRAEESDTESDQQGQHLLGKLVAMMRVAQMRDAKRVEMGWVFVFTTEEGGDYCWSAGTEETVLGWFRSARDTGAVHLPAYVDPQFQRDMIQSGESKQIPIAACWIAKVMDGWGLVAKMSRGVAPHGSLEE